MVSRFPAKQIWREKADLESGESGIGVESEREREESDGVG